MDVVLEDLEESADLSTASADLVLIFGGDGSILSAARRMGENQIPVFGVNFGKLGFLTLCSADEFEERLGHVLDRGIRVLPRMMLEARLVREGREIYRSLALNDGVIGRVTLSRMIEVRLSVEEETVTTTVGDGLIVSTPVGSTAHSLSAGGPIVQPEMEAIVLTPICPHTLSHRPLVLPPDRAIRCELAGDATEAMLTMDGQDNRELRLGDHVLFGRARPRFLLVDANPHSYYTVLRKKLHWGIPPRLDESGGGPMGGK